MTTFPITLLALVAATSASNAAFIAFATGGTRGHAIVLGDMVTRVTTTSPRVRIGYLAGATADSFVQFGTTTIDHPLNPATNPAGAIGGFITSLRLTAQIHLQSSLPPLPLKHHGPQ